MKKLFFSVFAFILVFALMAGFTTVDRVEASDELTLGYVNWACAEAKTYTAMAVLQEEMGFDVDTMMADAAPVYSAVAGGDVDAFLASWLPVTHQSYMEQYGDDLIKIGPNYMGARIGLVVPEYVDIDSIEELNANADKFDGQIIGIDAGAGIMQATDNAIPEYDLDLNLLEGSGAAMTAALSDAIQNEEWIVVTGWEPHWKFARWDLKFIEDPKMVYGEIENVYSLGRSDLGADYPEVVNFLHDFRMDSEQLGEVMGWISDGMEPLEAGKQWIAENEEIVESWLSPAQVSE